MTGNLEASLLLCEPFWRSVSQFVSAEKLLVAAPACDLLIVADANDPAGQEAVKAFLDRVSKLEIDHPLHFETYLWEADSWRCIPRGTA